MIGDEVSTSKVIMGERFWRLVVEHWRGHYSLARAFWLHYLPIAVIALWVLGESFTPDGMAEQYRVVELLQYGLWGALAVAWIWALVGTLQSGTLHVAQGGHPAVKTAALACIILTICLPPFLPLLYVLAMGFLPHR